MFTLILGLCFTLWHHKSLESNMMRIWTDAVRLSWNPLSVPNPHGAADSAKLGRTKTTGYAITSS